VNRTFLRDSIFPVRYSAVQIVPGWPSFGSHPLRLSGGGTSATDARKAPDPHKCFLCVRGIPHVSAPARASPRGAETSQKKNLCSFGGGGIKPRFPRLRCGRSWHGSFLARAASKGKCRPAQGNAASSFGLLTPRLRLVVFRSLRAFVATQKNTQPVGFQWLEEILPDIGKWDRLPACLHRTVSNAWNGIFQGLENIFQRLEDRSDNFPMFGKSGVESDTPLRFFRRSH